MTQEAILNKVRKLLRLAGNNNSPEEAAAAAAKAQELIDEHRLSEALLAYDEQAEQPDEAIEDFGDKGAWLHEDTRVQRWRYALAFVIARANGCKVYQSGGNLSLIGRASDADTVRYLFSYCVHEVERLTESHGRGCGATWRNNFRLGVVDTISRKLRDQKKAQQDQWRAEAVHSADASTALMRVNGAIAKVERRLEQTEAWTKANVKLRSGGGSRSQFHSGAREAGRRAGEAIHIGNRARGALA